MIIEHDIMWQIMRIGASTRRKMQPENSRQRPPHPGFGHILDILAENKGMRQQQIADILHIRPQSVSEAIKGMENAGIIRGYKTIIDRDKLDENTVSATIELKVIPKAERGFEEVAERIALYPEVESVSLMSGGCDLSVVVTGKTFRDVSAFVAHELATIDAVTATSTQFIMRRYKKYGVLLTDEGQDERDAVSL